MKLVSKIKRFVRKPIVAAALATAVFGVAAWSVTPANTHAAGQDCDNNAVIWCGATGVGQLNNRYDSGDGHNSAASIHNIYNCGPFNISTADIHNMQNEPTGTEVKNGVVTRSGKVELNDGTVVATGAITAGRQNIAGSTTHTGCGTTFYSRTPDVSFVAGVSQLDAMIVMKNGVFQFAILNSCGNPVTANPKTPNYSVVKEVSIKGQGNFSNNVTVPLGGHVEYKITVQSNGDVPVENTVVTDELPKDVKEVAGTMMRTDKNGNTSAASDTNLFNGGSTPIDSLAPGQTVIYKFEAVAGNTGTPDAASCKALVNTADINAPGLPKKSNTATVKTTCTPPPTTPTAQCTGLSKSLLNDTNYQFVMNGTVAGGAEINSFTIDFGDGTHDTIGAVANGATRTATTTHNYTMPSTATTYTIHVEALQNVNGTVTPVTSSACQTSIALTPAPVKSGVCNALNVATTDNLTFAAAATYSVTGGATLVSSSINWGDGSAVAAGTTSGNTATFPAHTYANQTASYTAKATLVFSVGGVASSDCSKPININGPQPAYSCDLFTLSADNTTRVATVTALNTTAINGAVFKNADIAWGDGATDTGLTSVVGKTHTYAAVNNYNVVATAHFTVNGQDVTASSAACAKPANFTSACVPTASQNPDCTPKVCTPPQTGTYPNCTTPCVPATNQNADCTPKTLVNTGAGSVAGLFTAATVLGTLGYYWVLNRRLSSES